MGGLSNAPEQHPKLCLKISRMLSDTVQEALDRGTLEGVEKPCKIQMAALHLDPTGLDAKLEASPSCRVLAGSERLGALRQLCDLEPLLPLWNCLSAVGLLELVWASFWVGGVWLGAVVLSSGIYCCCLVGSLDPCTSSWFQGSRGHTPTGLFSGILVYFFGLWPPVVLPFSPKKYVLSS